MIPPVLAHMNLYSSEVNFQITCWIERNRVERNIPFRSTLPKHGTSGLVPRLIQVEVQDEAAREDKDGSNSGSTE